MVESVTTWRLPIYAFDEDGRNRMRLVSAQIGNDRCVQDFSLTADPDSPHKHWLTIEFISGVNRPEQNAVKYLDRYLRLLNPALPPKKEARTRWERLLGDGLTIEPEDGV